MKYLSLLIILYVSQIWGSKLCVRNEYMINSNIYSRNELCLDSENYVIRNKETGSIINTNDSIIEMTEIYDRKNLSIIGGYTRKTFKYIAGGMIVISGIAIRSRGVGEFGISLIKDREYFDCFENENYSLIRNEYKNINVHELSIDNCDSNNTEGTDYNRIKFNEYQNQAKVDTITKSISVNTINEFDTNVVKSKIESEWKPKHSYSVTAGVIGAIVTTIAGYYTVGKLGLINSNSDGTSSIPPVLIMTPVITIPLGAIIGIYIDEKTK